MIAIGIATSPVAGISIFAGRDDASCQLSLSSSKLGQAADTSSRNVQSEGFQLRGKTSRCISHHCRSVVIYNLSLHGGSLEVLNARYLRW